LAAEGLEAVVQVVTAVEVRNDDGDFQGNIRG
jgi:hypothetical protein